MTYRLIDAPDTDIIHLALSIGQIKLLDSLVGFELRDVEHGESLTDENALQGLCDVFWQHLRVRMSEAEELATRQPWLDACKAGNEAFNAEMARQKLERSAHD